MGFMDTEIHVNFDEFSKTLEVGVSRVLRGTKKATKAACIEILNNSLNEVPRATSTLALSGFYEVIGSYRNFVGIVGYGGNGDPINPKTLKRASEYMVVVHEDLQARHPNGKAKFLEDPVRAYAGKFASRAAAIISKELGG